TGVPSRISGSVCTTETNVGIGLIVHGPCVVPRTGVGDWKAPNLRLDPPARRLAQSTLLQGSVGRAAGQPARYPPMRWNGPGLSAGRASGIGGPSGGGGSVRVEGDRTSRKHTTREVTS